MTTARDIMTMDVEFAAPSDSVRDIARRMDRLDLGMLPVCNADMHLVGTITDRDLALKVVGEGRDPDETAINDVLVEGEVVTIGADDPIEEALTTMERYAVRRLPVIDGNQVVGIISQADVAIKVGSSQAGTVVEGISDSPPN